MGVTLVSPCAERATGCWHSVRVQRWDDLSDVEPGFGPSVVTIGNFDGVHRGHAAVLGEVVGLARARGRVSAAVTFDPHPLQVLHPDRAPGLLTGLDHRLDLPSDARRPVEEHQPELTAALLHQGEQPLPDTGPGPAG